MIENNTEWLHHMLSHCDDNQHQLTDWECEFIQSVGDRLFDEKPLTQRQVDTLEKIYGKVS